MGRWCVALVLTASMATSSAALADDSTWHTYAALRNDAFTDLTPPLDDQGFTHDNAFSLVRTRGDLGFGGRFMHRWLTSNVDYRRWDQLEVVSLVEWRVPTPTIGDLPFRIDTIGRFGPTLGGNFGGRYLQNGWHSLSGTGPTLESGYLADDYPGDRRIGVLAGARGRLQLGDDRLQGYAIVDVQAGLGGGVSSFETVLGGASSARHLGAHVELAASRYHVSDDNLALPGGYGRGWQLEWRIGFHIAWSRFRVSYEYRANEGGSDEPIGVIAFESWRR